MELYLIHTIKVQVFRKSHEIYHQVSFDVNTILWPSHNICTLHDKFPLLTVIVCYMCLS